MEYWAWPLPVGFVDNNGKAIFVSEAAFQDGTLFPMLKEQIEKTAAETLQKKIGSMPRDLTEG